MHCHLFTCSLMDLLKFLLGPLQEKSRVSYKGNSRGVFLMRFLLYSLVSSSFLVFLMYCFVYFSFHLHLVGVVLFQYSQLLVSFHSPIVANFSLFGSSIPFVICRFPLPIISRLTVVAFCG